MDEQLHRIRHSAAHVMAQAVRERFISEGPVLYGVGPATADGFYYDFDLPRTVNEEDLRWIEKRMRKILARNLRFERQVVSEQEARETFAGDSYKMELIDGIVRGIAGFDGDLDAPSDASVELTTYTHGEFTDLCAGPHVDSTKDIDPKAVKLLSVAGAYWRGDEKRPMMQRIYGTAFASVGDLEKFVWQRAEAARRDHRKLGQELELFHFEPTAPGMPYWLPNGLRILNTLLEFWREEHEERDYQETSSPLINEKALWETSGHWEHYRDHMFIIPVDEHRTFGVKPMNCPNAMVMFNVKTRSYRDLPLRLSDCDVLHRNERTGALHGLLRVQHIQQDDAHIFLEPDQVKDEYRDIFEIAERFYSVFDLPYRLRLGTRPESFIGEIETWNEAEQVLHEILDEQAGPGNYIVEDGDGAFYGPKIDILMEDALGARGRWARSSWTSTCRSDSVASTTDGTVSGTRPSSFIESSTARSNGSSASSSSTSPGGSPRGCLPFRYRWSQ